MNAGGALYESAQHGVPTERSQMATRRESGTGPVRRVWRARAERAVWLEALGSSLGGGEGGLAVRSWKGEYGSLLLRCFSKNAASTSQAPRGSKSPAISAILADMRLAPLFALACVLACSLGSVGDLNRRDPERFRMLRGGATQDSRTGLVWAARDSNRELSWPEARTHCHQKGDPAKPGEWRLPTIQELRSLYDPAASQPCGDVRCQAPPEIALSSPYQWSGTARGARRRGYFDFQHGSELAPIARPTLSRHVLCVRAPLS